jgi:hypothetical protein
VAKRLASCRLPGHDPAIFSRTFISFLVNIYRRSPQEDVKLLMRIVTSPTLLEDLSQLDPLLATEGWNTLMTFTRESGCAFFPLSRL